MSPTPSESTHSIPLLDLKAQYATIREEIRVAIDRVIEAQQFILGPEVEVLERKIATIQSVNTAVVYFQALGINALLVALMAIDTAVSPKT